MKQAIQEDWPTISRKLIDRSRAVSEWPRHCNVFFSRTAVALKTTFCNLDLLARDAMQARPMPSCGVCVSICPSVCHVNSVKTSNRIFQFFSPSDSQTILIFSTPYVMAIYWRRHRMQVWNKSRFWANSWLSIDDCWS